MYMSFSQSVCMYTAGSTDVLCIVYCCNILVVNILYIFIVQCLTVCCFLGAFDLLTFMSCVYRGFVCISVCGVCISYIIITGLEKEMHNYRTCRAAVISVCCGICISHVSVCYAAICRIFGLSWPTLIYSH